MDNHSLIDIYMIKLKKALELRKIKEDSQEENDILDELDTIWYQLNDEELETLRKRIVQETD